MDDSEALERFRDEQMMQALEEGWFNAHYAFLFRDRVMPASLDPVAEDVTGWFDLDTDSGNFHVDFSKLSTDWSRAVEYGIVDTQSGNFNATDFMDYVYETSVELFEELHLMRAFNADMGGSFYDDEDYRLLEWRAW